MKNFRQLGASSTESIGGCGRVFAPRLGRLTSFLPYAHGKVWPSKRVYCRLTANCRGIWHYICCQ